ncbi:MAG: hypothetical protein E7283_04265 [Lachnospiraceae bacterium]|nr:hypothetical protein [Lachnospiraceae bacterium]
MKKRGLSFILVVMMVVTMLPMTAFAAEMSDAFKAILNEDGKLLVTESSGEDAQSFLSGYIARKANATSDGSYSFTLDEYRAEDGTCVISRIDNMDYSCLETYELEIVYEDVYSDAFKAIFEDGKVVVSSYSENGADAMQSVLMGHFSKYDTESCSFQASYVNEDATECTVSMYQYDQYGSMSLAEQHIVQVTYDEKYSEEFLGYLNSDGKFEMNSVLPTTPDDFYGYFEVLFMSELENGMNFSYVSEDASSFDLTINYGKPTQETHTVELVYNYDEDVQEKLVAFIESFPEDIEYFNVRDLELINYWLNNAGTEEANTLDSFSGELKSYLNYNNIKFFVDNRAGADEPFYTERLGVASFMFDDVVYHIDYFLGTRAEHVIYVPDNTENTSEALMKAAQSRIDEYIGAGKIELTHNGTVYDTWVSELYELSRWEWEQENPNLTLEEFKAMGNIYIPAYEDFAEMIYIEGVKEDDPCYAVNIKDGANTEDTFYIIVRADSSKMVTPEYKTVDVKNNVEISSDSADIPLDTSIEVDKLTSGTVYDKIMEVLGVEENETYDLKLYSDSLKDYFSKLENGSFEVRIPVAEKLKDKELVAYYVDANDKVVEYSVSIEDGYAVFATNHFSIYTLAEKTVVEENFGDGSIEEKQEEIVEKIPFTEEEKAQIESGAEVKVTLELKDISETVSATDKTLIEDKVEENVQIGIYLDVNMFKQIGNNEAVKIPELKETITIQFTVPDELLVLDGSKNRVYNIVRVHDGVATILDAKFDAETKTISFETDCFSTYALVYIDEPITGTGDLTSSAWLAFTVIGLAVVCFGMKKRYFN